MCTSLIKVICRVWAKARAKTVNWTPVYDPKFFPKQLSDEHPSLVPPRVIDTKKMRTLITEVCFLLEFCHLLQLKDRMRPGSAEIWFVEFDRLDKIYNSRCKDCQSLLVSLSKIKIPTKKTEKDKELEREKNDLLKQLRIHRATECKQVNLAYSLII